MSGVQQLKISEGEGDQRLDRWFRRKFPEIPQGRIEKMCRKGEIRVNGGRVKPATRVETGQTVRIPPLSEAPSVLSQIPSMSEGDAEWIRQCVIYKDDYILALNKPPGLPSQGGTKQARHVDGLSEALRFGFEDKPRLVHRLDKDTSGVLLLARTRSVASKLTKAFRARDTRKIYWAAVAGTPNPSMGIIRYGLVKAPGHGKGGEGEKMMTLHPKLVDETDGAKPATTHYAVLSSLGTRVSWAALIPVTGRTHQLRAHMSAIGHPIVGDGKYGGSGQENMGDGWGAQLGGEVSRKLHLHARSIGFTHPVTEQRVTITAHLPPHMSKTWQMFDWETSDVPLDPFDQDIQP